MAPMRQQPIPDDSFSEAEAMRIVRGLATGSLPRPPQTPARADVLARTVEDEVIPRLLKARGLASPAEPAEQALASRPDPDHVEELVRLLLTGTPGQSAAYVESVHACGLGADALLLDLLTRTARRLGDMWLDDLCDFTEVTVGVMRLNNVMRLVCSAFGAEEPSEHDAPRALLVQAPGEQHGFGLAMVAHFFRRAGWNVHTEPRITRDDLVGLVRHHRFGIVGISVSCSDRMEVLTASIGEMRRASCNPALCVMVGGLPFIENPHLARQVGADATAADARLAVQQAHILLCQNNPWPGEAGERKRFAPGR